MKEISAYMVKLPAFASHARSLGSDVKYGDVDISLESETSPVYIRMMTAREDICPVRLVQQVTDSLFLRTWSAVRTTPIGLLSSLRANPLGIPSYSCFEIILPVNVGRIFRLDVLPYDLSVVSLDR